MTTTATITLMATTVMTRVIPMTRRGGGGERGSVRQRKKSLQTAIMTIVVTLATDNHYDNEDEEG